MFQLSVCLGAGSGSFRSITLFGLDNSGFSIAVLKMTRVETAQSNVKASRYDTGNQSDSFS